MTVSIEEKKAQLRSYVKKKEGLNVVLLISSNRDCQCVGELVGVAIDEGCPHVEDIVMRHFLSLKSKVGFDRWVSIFAHNVSYILWRRRGVLWLKELYRGSFRQLTSLTACESHRKLIMDFITYARGEDDPKSFGIIHDHLVLVSIWSEYPFDRITQAPFGDEKEFLLWKFHHPGIRYAHDPETGIRCVNVDELCSLISQLEVYGYDTTKLKYDLQLLVVTCFKDLQECHSSLYDQQERDRVNHILTVVSHQLARIKGWSLLQKGLRKPVH